MSHHFSLQGIFTRDKVMQHAAFLNSVDTHPEFVQDADSARFGNIFGTLQLPHFLNQPAYERLLLGVRKSRSI